MSRLFEQSPKQVAARMQGGGLRRGYLIYDPHAHELNVSHPLLRELADWLISHAPDFRAHEAIFLSVAPQTGALFAAFIHKTARGQAQGGLRHWPYESLGALLCDGLRLSRGMTRKNALAGLWWGGGKGIIARSESDADSDPARRRLLFREYGDFVSSLRGCYITAEDAGTNPADVAEVFHSTRFITCIPPNFGGAGNPSAMTAAGVVCAMEAALEFLELGALRDKRIALQGAGHVGGAMVAMLLERGVRSIVASDVSAERRSALLDAFEGQPVEVRLASPGADDILEEPCDVLVPAALGGVLGPKTIPGIRARVVCGPANNQLVDTDRDSRALQARGITYVPDFVANRMGIVYCGNEQYGYVNGDPMMRRHLSHDWAGGIHATTLRVLGLARAQGITPAAAACALADELAEQPHPIWGHRSLKIIESLVADRWERG